MKERRFQLWCYRLFLRLMPQAHRQRHGALQIQTFSDLVATGTSPWRLWMNAIPDLFDVYRNQYPDWRQMMRPAGRLVLIPLSVMSLLAGLGLFGLAVFGDQAELGMFLAAVGLIAQGGFTMVWAFDVFGRFSRLGDALFIVGESLALVLGIAALSGAVAAQAIVNDPEYGRLTILSVVIGHGVVGLFVGTSRSESVSRPT